MLAGQFCLQRHGWRGSPRGPVEVLVPHGAYTPSAPAFMRVRQSVLNPGVRRLQGMPCVEPALATVQAAGWASSERESMFLVVSCLQQRLVAPHQLRRILDRHPNLPRGRLVRDTVQEYVGGATSMNEITFGRLCKRFGVPAPIRQRRRKDSQGRPRYLDAEFRTASGAILIVEIDGIHHLNPENWLEDIDRQNGLVVETAGMVLRASSWSLRHEPEHFMPQLAQIVNNT